MQRGPPGHNTSSKIDHTLSVYWRGSFMYGRCEKREIRLYERCVRRGSGERQSGDCQHG